MQEGGEVSARQLNRYSFMLEKGNYYDTIVARFPK